MPGLGFIQVYTGNGKGKTTASLGLAFRACGHGFKVCMIQFMKENQEYGEVKAATHLPGFEIYQVGRNDFVNLQNPEDIDVQLAQKGWCLAKSKILSGEYNVVILDEINVAVACKLIAVEAVLQFINEEFKPMLDRPELILSGRYAPAQIIEAADLVTEMREVKHYYSTGVSSRQGIDY